MDGKMIDDRYTHTTGAVSLENTAKYSFFFCLLQHVKIHVNILGSYYININVHHLRLIYTNNCWKRTKTWFKSVNLLLTLWRPDLSYFPFLVFCNSFMDAQFSLHASVFLFLKKEKLKNKFIFLNPWGNKILR